MKEKKEKLLNEVLLKMGHNIEWAIETLLNNGFIPHELLHIGFALKKVLKVCDSMGLTM